MAKLFISYSSHDREMALHIADDLQAAGHEVWIDRKGISGGAIWAAEIVKGIETCDHFMLLMSPHSLASDNVRKEIDIAAEENKLFIPIRLKPIPKLPREFRYHLAGIQHIDFEENYPSGVKAVLEILTPSIQADESGDLYRQGMAAYENKKYDQAIIFFNKLITLDDTFRQNNDLTAILSRAYFYHGNFLYVKKKYQEACTAFNQAVQLAPQFALAHLYQGNTHRKMDNFHLAIQSYTRAIEIDVQFTEAYLNRGLILLNQKFYTQAIEDFTQAIEFDPQESLAFIYRAEAYEALGHLDLARQDQEEAKRLGYRG